MTCSLVSLTPPLDAAGKFPVLLPIRREWGCGGWWGEGKGEGGGRRGRGRGEDFLKGKHITAAQPASVGVSAEKAHLLDF